HFSRSAHHPTLHSFPTRRSSDLMDALRERRDYICFALMVTDIATQGTCLLVSGEESRVERALGDSTIDGVVDLPGVMSRKKQLRSEEHTSELQSRGHLVCRLLLE